MNRENLTIARYLLLCCKPCFDPTSLASACVCAWNDVNGFNSRLEIPNYTYCFISAPSMVRRHSKFLPLAGKLCSIFVVLCVCYVVLCVTFSPHPLPLTVTQALKFMMDLEDDSDWSLSDEPEDEDSTR